MSRRSSSVYDRLSPIYDRRWSLYIDRSIELARAHLFANPGDRMLDVGCGTGRLLERVTSQEPAVRSFGVEPSAGMLEVCRRRLRGQAHLVRGRADNLPLCNASMDWLVSTSVLHHLQNPAVALDEFHRVLRPGGRLVVVDWAADFFAMRMLAAWMRRREDAAIRVVATDEMSRLLRHAGFERVDVRARRMTWAWGMLVATAQRAASA